MPEILIGKDSKYSITACLLLIIISTIITTNKSICSNENQSKNIISATSYPLDIP